MASPIWSHPIWGTVSRVLLSGRLANTNIVDPFGSQASDLNVRVLYGTLFIIQSLKNLYHPMQGSSTPTDT